MPLCTRTSAFFGHIILLVVHISVKCIRDHANHHVHVKCSVITHILHTSADFLPVN